MLKNTETAKGTSEMTKQRMVEEMAVIVARTVTDLVILDGRSLEQAYRCTRKALAEQWPTIVNDVMPEDIKDFR